MAIQAPASKNRDWFLYLMLHDRICRLNIDEFCKNNSPKPQFEVVHDYYLDEGLIPHKTIPLRMLPIVVNSQVYMLGGSTPSDDPQSTRSNHDDDSEDDSGTNPERVRWQGYDTYVPNLDVFAFDPDASEGPMIRRLNEGGTIPRRIFDLRVLADSRVFTLEDKIYVMALASYSGGDEKDIDHQPPLFRVFDPLHQFWKELPRPPHCNVDGRSFRDLCGLPRPPHCNVDGQSFRDVCFWGHNLVVSTYTNRPTFYHFDSHKERWEEWPEEKEDEYKKKQFVFEAAVEFEGFIIGVKYNFFGYDDQLFDEIGVYELGPNGVPKLIRTLDELQGIFCPFLRVDRCIMGRCDGGKIWLAYCSSERAFIRVAVFQVSISDDGDGNPVFSTELQAAEYYMFQIRGSCGYRDHLYLDYGFSMCHHANKREIEEKNLCGRIIKHDHPRV